MSVANANTVHLRAESLGCSTQSNRRAHGLDEALDHTIMRLADRAVEEGIPTELSMPIRNVHRTVGAMLSGEIDLT